MVSFYGGGSMNLKLSGRSDDILTMNLDNPRRTLNRHFLTRLYYFFLAAPSHAHFPDPVSYEYEYISFLPSPPPPNLPVSDDGRHSSPRS